MPPKQRVAFSALLRSPANGAPNLWNCARRISFSRLLAWQARRDEARSLLSEIYGWFTDGFDTADLKDAKVLLNELSA